MKKRKIVLYIAASLDGYIAAENDSLEWLFRVSGEGDNGYSEFLQTIDTILMGRRTYEWIMNGEKGDFPYKEQKCYVFSRTLKSENSNVEFISEDLASFARKLMETDGKNIWIVGGGDLLQHFINEGLVDEFIITVAPIIIGKGIPLFQNINIELELKLISMRRFNEFAELHYQLK